MAVAEKHCMCHAAPQKRSDRFVATLGRRYLGGRRRALQPAVQRGPAAATRSGQSVAAMLAECPKVAV